MQNKTVRAVMVAGLLITYTLGPISAGESASQVPAQTATGAAPTPSTANADPASVEQTVEVRLTE